MDEEGVRRALASVLDPELGLDIVSLGLVYRLECRGDAVELDLTMTTPACPLAEHIREEAERAIVQAFPNAKPKATLVWSPPWDARRLSSDAKAALGW
jgi:metal-sulfur cluster biosynthetic enzyme